MLLLAASLRLLRGVVRWDEVAWQYAAYPGATVRALGEGDLVAALTTWVGLHPPGWQLIHAAQEIWLPVPALFLATSVLFSLAAVWIWRDRPLVALVLATSPVQLAYAAEVNDYPLVALLIAAAFRWRDDWKVLAGIGAVACWTHPLAAVVVGLLALRQARALGVMALAALPLLPGAYGVLTSGDTYGQPELLFGQSAADVIARFGGLGLVLLGFAIAGARREKPVTVVLIISGSLYLMLVSFGIAAPHQFMYWLLFTCPLALLADAGAQGRWRGALVALCLLQAAWFGAFDSLRIAALSDGDRGVDVALETTSPGDAIYLLAPPGTNDDDKSKSSAVLWRLAPWQRMPMASPYAFSYEDHRHGQPRLVDERTVYVNDALRPELDEAIAAHSQLVLVVYEANATLLLDVTERYGAGESVGVDTVWRFESE
ncbi:MAG: hypothetical protein GY913_24335 [Proteobacteria bacterium]|nr:hypothetical protein [Pseudomonadota bacterium]MCP4920044.1 hypothetical protein [Pseudomonadota bacterium]